MPGPHLIFHKYWTGKGTPFAESGKLTIERMWDLYGIVFQVGSEELNKTIFDCDFSMTFLLSKYSQVGAVIAKLHWSEEVNNPTRVAYSNCRYIYFPIPIQLRGDYYWSATVIGHDQNATISFSLIYKEAVNE